MKKFTTLFLAAGMLMAAAAPANAVDVKLDGTYAFSFESGSMGFGGANFEKALQRLRLGATMTASDNLSGYVQFQMGTDDWGTADSNAGFKNVSTRQIYIDWTVPSTDIKVRMGRSCLGLPAEAFGSSSVIDSGWGSHDGVIVDVPVADWLGLNAMWVRAGSDGEADLDAGNNADMFALAAPMKFTGFSITPYVAYASIDDGASGNITVSDGDATLGMVGRNFQVVAEPLAHDSNVFWAGFTSTLTAFDPFIVKLSFVYGHQNYEGDGPIVGGREPNHAGGWNVDDRSGWNVQLKASYQLPFGTPIVGAWYASGDDGDSKAMRDGWMPTINGRFVATQDFHDGAYGLGGGLCTYNIAGTWGIQAGIEQMSFLQDLTHDFKVTYIQGTNNTKWIKEVKGQFEPYMDITDMGAYAGPYSYLTTSDSLVEISLSNTYQIYKNLAANFEMAYTINNFDEDLYTVNGAKNFTKDDWRAALTFEYSF